jgi:hypothetical protein
MERRGEVMSKVEKRERERERGESNLFLGFVLALGACIKRQKRGVSFFFEEVCVRQ